MPMHDTANYSHVFAHDTERLLAPSTVCILRTRHMSAGVITPAYACAKEIARGCNVDPYKQNQPEEGIHLRWSLKMVFASFTYSLRVKLLHRVAEHPQVDIIVSCLTCFCGCTVDMLL